MKKFLFILLAFSFIPLAYAEPTANIKIKISGAKDNKYFLCIPNVGCLSILAAQRGKIYPVFHSVDMDKMYVVNSYTFRLHSQGLPKSCNVTVNTNQTITISGQLSSDSGNQVRVSNLRCSVS